MKRRSDQEIAEAVAEYVGGLNMAEVAKMYGTNETTVSGWMRAAGVTRPKGSSRALREAQSKRGAALLDIARTGDSIPVVAKRHGIPRRTLEQWHDADRDLAYEGDWMPVGGILRPVPREAA